MTSEQREKRKLAKRIIKAVQPALEDAVRIESELIRRPFDQQIKAMDMLESRRGSLADSIGETNLIPLQPLVQMNGTERGRPGPRHETDVEVGNGTCKGQVNDTASNHQNLTESSDFAMRDVTDEDGAEGEELAAARSVAQLNHELSADAEQTIVTCTPPASTNGIKKEADLMDSLHISRESPVQEPPTPPMSMEGSQPILSHGGIPWYIEAFDISGTTIQEERWTGKDVLRDMEEELSEMDDEELQDLGADFEEKENADAEESLVTVQAVTSTASANRNLKKNGKQKKRWRGFR